MKGIHKYKLSLIPLGLVAITLLSGYFLSHVTLGAHADTNKTSTVSVRVADTCSMTGEVTAEHSASLINGQSKTGIGTTELTTICNDNNGYAIYAVGYGFLNSADMNSGTGTMGVTDLLGATSGLKISTANWADRNTGDNASKSIWSMTLLPWDGTSDPTRPVSNNPTIVNGYDSYMAVPSTYTKVASFPSSTITETATKSVVKTSYAAKIADVQTADTYVGQVKYTMVHPSSNTATGFTFDDAFQLAGKSRVSGTSYFAMQDMNAAICNKVTELNNNFPETQLIDIRDNNVYTIKKINGDCWMTQNLRFLGNTGSATNKMVMTSNTSNGANTTLDLYSLNSSDAGNFGAYADRCDSTNGYNNACVYDSGSETTGVWYNYYAASAGNISTNSNQNAVSASGPSVCPAGWHLPTGAANSTSSEFYKVFNSTSTSWIDPGDYLNAFRAVTGGRYRNGSLGSTDSGRWWSATASDATLRYYLIYNGSQFGSGSDVRYFGFFVRCIADNSMQTFDSTAASSLAINESLQLRDERDGKTYWATKLADGNVWMTQNLDLDLSTSTTLTHADTDLGWTNLDTNATWTPVRSTIDSTAYNNTASGASGGILTYNGSNSHNLGFVSGWTNDDNTPYSVDPGYRYVVPKEMSGPNTNWYDNGDTFYYCTNQDTTCGGNSENGHYTMGNYYNFAAASATNNVETTLGGSDNVVQDKVMPDSICPKGWRLPIDQTTNNEFSTLLGPSNYNIYNGSDSELTFENLNAIRTAPLYFVRSGLVYGGMLHNAGVASNAWSSTISSSTDGYYLDFGSTDINPAFSNNRYRGFPVRCLLRTE